MRKLSTHFLCILILSLNFISTFKTVVNAKETIEPIEFDYIILSEDWTFIEIIDLRANQTIDYEWLSDIKVNGREVISEQYQLMLSMSLSERFIYFESIGFTNNKFDSGSTIANIEGKLFFVFYNPELDDANLHLILIYRNNLMQPWIIGSIAASATLVFLTVLVIMIIKLRQKIIEKQMKEQEKSPAQRYLEI